MPRIVFPSIRPDDKEIIVTGQNLKYLKTVIRCSIGDEVVVLDGRGLALITAIKHIRKDQIILNPLSIYPIDTESPLRLFLIQGLLKGDSMDFVIQKTTELGIKEIFPVVTERTQVRFTRRVSHWRRVAEEATKQSKRLLVPVIHEICKIDEIFDILDEKSLRVILYEHEDKSIKDLISEQSLSRPSSKFSSSVYYMVGPEGGFTDGEVNRAKDAGFLSSGLGKRILRAETASITAALLLQFLYGDL